MEDQEKNIELNKQVYCKDCKHVQGFLDYLNEEVSSLSDICLSCYAFDIEDSAPLSIKVNFEEK